MELILNCDMVIASEDAVFALPEVKRGVLASQGGTCPCSLSSSAFVSASRSLRNTSIAHRSSRRRFLSVWIEIDKR